MKQPRFLSLLIGALALAIPESHAIERVSVPPGSGETNENSNSPTISDSGRYVAFASTASNLVPNDTNNAADIFVSDRQTGEITRVSVDSAGNQHNGFTAFYPAISGDGRYVAFISDGANLVTNDNNGHRDAFLHDRETGVTTRISVHSNGNEGNATTTFPIPSLSVEGRFIAFSSPASNLVDSDNNLKTDIFVRDRLSGTTTRASVTSTEVEANGDSEFPSISDDGRFVAFESRATNFDARDFNGKTDILVRDRQSGTTTRVFSLPGGEGNGDSHEPEFSGNGRFVVFHSRSTNWVTPDANGTLYDVFLFNRETREMTLVSVSSEGVQGNDDSTKATVSSDGRYVTFTSEASNLVSGDTNGKEDIFVRDVVKGTTRRISVAADNSQASEDCDESQISGNGKLVVFNSRAGNLKPPDFNLFDDVFLAANPTPKTEARTAILKKISKFKRQSKPAKRKRKNALVKRLNRQIKKLKGQLRKL